MTIHVSGHLEVEGSDHKYTGEELMKYRETLEEMRTAAIDSGEMEWAEAVSHVRVVLFLVAQMMED